MSIRLALLRSLKDDKDDKDSRQHQASKIQGQASESAFKKKVSKKENSTPSACVMSDSSRRVANLKSRTDINQETSTEVFKEKKIAVKESITNKKRRVLTAHGSSSIRVAILKSRSESRRLVEMNDEMLSEQSTQKKKEERCHVSAYGSSSLRVAILRSRQKVDEKSREPKARTKKRRKKFPVSPNQEKIDNEAIALMDQDCVAWDFVCSCGIAEKNYDDGVDMIQCRGCYTWQHDSCVVEMLRGHPLASRLGALRELRYLCFRCCAERYLMPGETTILYHEKISALEERKDIKGIKSKDLAQGISIYVRKDENFGDHKIVNEVLVRRVYEKPKIWFEIVPGEKWIDCGGHIGTFSALALASGAFVVAIEPCPQNFKLLQINGQANVQPHNSFRAINAAVLPQSTRSNTTLLYLHTTSTAFRHSVHISREEKGWIPITVHAIQLSQLIEQEQPTGVKIDVQGLERALVDSITNWGSVQKLVFEYDFEYEPSLPHFHAFIERLKHHFPIIYHPRLRATGQFIGFPNGVLVHALRGDITHQLPPDVIQFHKERWQLWYKHLESIQKRQVRSTLLAALNSRFPHSPHTHPSVLENHLEDDDDLNYTSSSSSDDDEPIIFSRCPDLRHSLSSSS
uniref:Methyltransferase FkbM domain-containing protein n=1 Tax=Aureoumbra lagunensis TaxID=44058 RepID=A0A7S3JPP9_9STRA